MVSVDHNFQNGTCSKTANQFVLTICYQSSYLWWPHSFISGDIDGVGLITVLYWIGEGDDMGFGVGEHFRQRILKLLVGWVVGTQGKYPIL